MLLAAPLCVLAGLAVAGRFAQKKPSVYLYGIIIGWFLSTVSFSLYIGGQYYFYNTFISFWGLTRSFWHWIAGLPVVHEQRDWLIALLNLGVSVFIYSFVQYALLDGARCGRLNPGAIRWAVFGFFALQTILLNPLSHRLIEALHVAKRADLYPLYFFMKSHGVRAFRALNTALLLCSVGLFFYRYRRVPRIRILKLEYLYKCIALTLVAIGYHVLFSWFPEILIRPTSVRNYFLYNVPNIDQQVRFINYFFIVPLALFVVTLLLMRRYSAAVSRDRGIRVKLDQSARTASMGMRIFTHAIKNELQAVGSEAEYLSGLMADDGEAAYSVKLIREACARALKSIDVNYETLKTRQFHLLLTPVLDAIDASCGRFEARGHGVRIERGAFAQPLNAYLDRPNFQSVLDNMLDNAAEAIQAAGREGDGLIRVGVRQAGGWISITIEDNGAGIAEADRERIFEPFYSTKSSATNWGVGLSYCYSTIAAHGGSIQVRSEPGKGTTFEILIPNAQ